MSQENVETLRGVYEAVSHGDWDAAFRAAHPDLEWTTPDNDPSPGTYRGPEEVRRFYEDLFEPLEEVVLEPEEFFESGDDQIVVFVLARLRPKGSSAFVEVRVGHLWTMRDAKAFRCEVFPERNKALEAVGLSEQDAHADS